MRTKVDNAKMKLTATAILVAFVQNSAASIDGQNRPGARRLDKDCSDTCRFRDPDSEEHQCCPGKTCVWLPTGDECLPDGTCIEYDEDCKVDEEFGDSCCEGSSCVDGICTLDKPKEDKPVEPTCTDECSADSDDCCEGHFCYLFPAGFKCFPEGWCIFHEDHCETDEKFGDSCCEGLECRDGHCIEPGAEPYCSDTCSFRHHKLFDCCPGNVCVGAERSFCAPEGTCVEYDEACQVDLKFGDSCCEGSSCVDGVCTLDSPKTAAPTVEDAECVC